MVHKHGVQPISARNLQIAIIQGTILYASELIWLGGDARGLGGKSVEKGYQKIINQMGRARTGTFRSTPLGIVMVRKQDGPGWADAGLQASKIHPEAYGSPQEISWPTRDIGAARHKAHGKAETKHLPRTQREARSNRMDKTPPLPVENCSGPKGRGFGSGERPVETAA